MNLDQNFQRKFERIERERTISRLHEVEGAVGIGATDVSTWELGAIRRRLERLSKIGASKVPASDFERVDNPQPVRLGDFLKRNR